MNIVNYIEVKASDAVPQDNEQYLWYDSMGITSMQEMMTYEEAKPLIGFVFDSWLKPVIIIKMGVYSEAS